MKKELKSTRIRIFDTANIKAYKHLAGMELNALFSSLEDEAYVTDPSTKDPVVIFPGDYMEVNAKENVKPPCDCAMCEAKKEVNRLDLPSFIEFVNSNPWNSKFHSDLAEHLSKDFAVKGKRLILVTNPNPTPWCASFLERVGWDLPKEGANIIDNIVKYPIDPKILEQLKKYNWDPSGKTALEVMAKSIEFASMENENARKEFKFSVFETWYKQQSEEVKKIVASMDELIKNGGSFKEMRTQIVNNFLEETYSKLKNLLPGREGGKTFIGQVYRELAELSDKPPVVHFGMDFAKEGSDYTSIIGVQVGTGKLMYGCGSYKTGIIVSDNPQFRGEWKANRDYHPNDVVTVGKKTYKMVTQDRIKSMHSPASQTISAKHWRCLTPNPTDYCYRGGWRPNEIYNAQDVVKWKGLYYGCFSTIDGGETTYAPDVSPTTWDTLPDQSFMPEKNKSFIVELKPYRTVYKEHLVTRIKQLERCIKRYNANKKVIPLNVISELKTHRETYKLILDNKFDNYQSIFKMLLEDAK